MQPLPEAIKHVRRARRKEQRRRFAENAADRQNTAGHNAVHAAWQHHRANGAPFARPQAKSPLAVALRHGFETLLRGAHDGRQVHDRQRQRARKQRRAIFAEDQHTDQAVDDRGDTRKRFRRIFDGGDKLFIRGVFVQIDRRAHAERQHDQKRCNDDIKRAQNVRQDADAVGKIAWRGGEHLPCDVWNTIAQYISNHKQNERTSQYCRGSHERMHQDNIGPAAGRSTGFEHSVSLLVAL